MWDCPSCGCKCIAGSLAFCPMCFKERQMASNPAGAAPSNALAGPFESGYIPPEPEPVVEEPVHVQEPVQEPVQDTVPEPEQPAQPEPEQTVQPEPEPEKAPEPELAAGDDDKPDYSAYAIRDLVDLCRERGIQYSGPGGTLPKDVLVARLTEQAGD